MTINMEQKEDSSQIIKQYSLKNTIHSKLFQSFTILTIITLT